MKIEDIVSKHYGYFLGMCTRTDKAIYGGKTSEDLLGDAVITTLNRYKGEDVDEEEGFGYLQKTFLESCLFGYKKKSYPEEKMIEYVEDYPKNI